MRCYVCSQFVENIMALRQELSQGTHDILQKLGRLYLLYYVDKNQGILMKVSMEMTKQFDILIYFSVQSGSMTSSEAMLLEEELCQVMKCLRSEAVNLVDAFDIDDRILNSTLGSWDGNVYERLYREALKSPLNATDVPDAIHKYLKPFMRSKL